jgi:hypothetical protein
MKYLIEFEKPTVDDASRIVRAVFKGISPSDVIPAAIAHIQGSMTQVMRHNGEVVGFANYERMEYLWRQYSLFSR